MMKVKRYIIILITIFISMFISCKSVNKKLEKMNSFKFIGVWKINSVEVFDEDEADYTDNMLNKEIKNIENKYIFKLIVKRFSPYILAIAFVTLIMGSASFIRKRNNVERIIINILIF